MKLRTGRWSQRTVKAVAVVFAIGALGAASGGCRGRSPEARVDHIADKIASKLDFTNEQKALLTKITDDLKKDFADERARKKALLPEMEQMLLADSLDQKRVKELIKARHDRMNSKVDGYLAKVADLHKALKPEQKKELVEYLQKFQRHWD